MSSPHQLVDIFTKILVEISYDATCTKLSMFDLFAPARGGVSKDIIELPVH